MHHILKTKLFIPHTRSKLVQRPHLIAKLDQYLDVKLTLVSAPAGFGKTTLVSNWLGHLSTENDPHTEYLSPKPCWISLDKSDNIQTQFARYLISALQRADPSLETKFSSLLEGQMPLSDRLMTILINELTGLKHQFILILDDYHLIDNTDIHAAISFMLEHLPPQLHLVVVTRADPPLPLSLLRARGQLMEVRADDLRFSLTEADIFLNHVMQLALESVDVAMLEERTEGWVASLQLAAVAMQAPRIKPEERHQFVTTFAGTDRYVVDYLVSEVLQQYPDFEVFLLYTATLNRFCAALCDYIRQGISHSIKDEPYIASQKMLKGLEKANLFLIPLDNQRLWYRYHHLVGGLLRYRLQEQFPERVAIIHRYASEWFEQNDFIEEAVTHALAAKAYEQATELIEQCAHTVFSEGKMPLIEQWMAQLPAKLIYVRPRLYMVKGWLLFRTGQFDGLEAHLQKPPTIDMASLSTLIQGEHLILQANSAFVRGHFDACQQLVKQGLKLLPTKSVPLIMSATTLLAWCAEAVDEISTAIQYHQQVTKMGLQADILTGTIASLGMLVQDYAYQHDHHQATAIFAQVSQFANERNVQWIPLLGPAYIGIGHVYHQQGRTDDAIQNLQEGISRCRQWGGLTIAALRGYTILLKVLQKAAKVEEAQSLLAEAKQFAQTNKAPAWAMTASLLRPPIASNPLDPLTRRERDVLRLLATGYSSPQIANELIIGVSTVRTHIKRIYGKLQVHSRTEAIAQAREQGLV